MLKEDVLGWIKRNHTRSKIIMSVCSGARILGKSGILDGLECTTHHEVMENLREIAPKAMIKTDKRFIDNGKILTSAGTSAGIDVANKTRIYMEYGDWESFK